MKKAAAFLGAALILLSAVWLLVGNPAVAWHNYRLKREILLLKTGDVVTLETLVPFPWERVYTFAPYTGKHQIEEQIGFRSGSVQETVSEGMVQLLFVKENSVTASICGYADALGYRITLEDSVSYGENIPFETNVRAGIVELTQRPQE